MERVYRELFEDKLESLSEGLGRSVYQLPPELRQALLDELVDLFMNGYKEGLRCGRS